MLPVVVDLVTAARVLRIGRTAAYRAATNGTFPVRVLRVGEKAYRVATADLIALLAPGEPLPVTSDEPRSDGD